MIETTSGPIGELMNGSTTRMRTMKPAAFEPTERKAVIGVGAPW